MVGPRPLPGLPCPRPPLKKRHRTAGARARHFETRAVPPQATLDRPRVPAVGAPYAARMAIDWGDAPAWAALALSVGSFGIATWAAVESRKSRQATEESADAAKRSAVAAERSHELAEQQYRDSLPPPVKLVVLPLRKDLYQLANDGTVTATGVTVDRSNLPPSTPSAPLRSVWLLISITRRPTKYG